MEQDQSTLSQPGKEEAKLKHVGGVNDEFGGVDPETDAELIRLSGGP